MSTTAPTFGTAILGQTEKALDAILHRELDGTGLTEPQWVTLTVTVMSGETLQRDELVARLAGVLKVGEAEAAASIDELAATHLLQAADGAPVQLTEAGRELHGRIRVVVTEITQRMWGDLPAEELDTAGRVLSTVLARANADLAGDGRAA